jgi:Cdc6-like AAA superfamily ATPase
MKDLIKCSKCGSYYDPRKNCKTCIRKKLWDEDIFPNRVLPIFPTRIQKGLLNFKFPNAVILTGCIYMYGPVSVGKTMLACASLVKTMEQNYLYGNWFGREGAFVNVPNLLQELRNSFATKSFGTTEQLIEKYKNVPFLVLDDVAVQSDTDWAYMVLYQIIDYRYNEYKTTAFTSNVALENLMTQMKDQRIPSRIMNMVNEGLGVMDMTNHIYEKP